jgi:hypothetical protein
VGVCACVRVCSCGRMCMYVRVCGRMRVSVCTRIQVWVDYLESSPGPRALLSEFSFGHQLRLRVGSSTAVSFGCGS